MQMTILIGDLPSLSARHRVLQSCAAVAAMYVCRPNANAATASRQV